MNGLTAFARLHRVPVGGGVCRTGAAAKSCHSGAARRPLPKRR